MTTRDQNLYEMKIALETNSIDICYNMENLCIIEYNSFPILYLYHLKKYPQCMRVVVKMIEGLYVKIEHTSYIINSIKNNVS